MKKIFYFIIGFTSICCFNHMSEPLQLSTMDENIDSIGYEYFLDVLLYSNATKKVFANKDEFITYINDSIDHSLNRIKGITALGNKLNYKFKIFVCAKDEFDITLYGIKYIASTGKPLEPNVPHHFAFRGTDDISYIISGYLAAKSAKKLGIRNLILQNMLNTPKYTIGLQDLAKGRTMLQLVRELEDDNFTVHLQSRAGLDYFSPDLDKAKIQLAAVTALMDDIEPNDRDSPEIIHVVSYCEAVRLATPPVINESIQITLAALNKYRKLRAIGQIENMAYNQELNERTEDMYQEAKEAIRILERYIPNLYTAEGLYRVFKEGFLPVPYMIDSNNKYNEATMWNTAIKNGGIRVIDEKGKVIRTSVRYDKIISCHG